jgi:hypothetical protein
MELSVMTFYWVDWLERIVGLSFVVSGTAKFLGLGEDTQVTLAFMAQSNTGTQLGPLSDWLAHHHVAIVYFVGAVMLGTGIWQALRLPASKLAAVAQLAMIICFVTFMHRGFPVIFFDGFYVMALVPILLRARQQEPVHA